MAYPLDTAAQNAVLDAILSRDLTSLPTSYEIALFNAHPLSGGTELTSTGGYIRPVIAADLLDFPAAVGGQKVSVPIALATSTGAWSDTATHYLLYDGADSVTAYFPGRLLEVVNVTDADQDAAVQLIAFWNTLSL